MNTPEKLAREIARVAALRGRHHGPLQRTPRVAADLVIDEACQAIGSADDGRMEAAGLRLKAIVE